MEQDHRFRLIFLITLIQPDLGLLSQTINQDNPLIKKICDHSFSRMIPAHTMHAPSRRG